MTGVSAAVLPKHLSHFGEIGHLKQSRGLKISRDMLGKCVAANYTCD